MYFKRKTRYILLNLYFMVHTKFEIWCLKALIYILFGKIQISFVLIWYIVSASWEVCSMPSWYRLQWNWCWRFAQCSADLDSNGTDAGGLLNAQLISPPMELMLEEVLNKCSAFINRSLILCTENQLFRIMSIIDRYCHSSLQIEIKKNL